MSITNLDKVELAFGHVALLDKVDLKIEPGERLCLIGVNGSGKSTMMKVLAGRQEIDDGSIWQQDGLRIAYLDQHVPETEHKTVFELVSDGLGQTGELVQRYHELAHQVAQDGSAALVQQLSDLQHELEAHNGWSLNQRVDTVISKLDLDPDVLVDSLSGGMRRRVILAQSLVNEPELLLLDEPTNHLDIESIKWLEEYLKGYPGTLLFVTHDRTFLRNLATRIIELDRGQLRSYPGDYETYLKRKEQELEQEAVANREFDKKLAQEESWIRQGIKARRTRNEGRVRALKVMREERQQRKELRGSASMQLESGELTGKIVADLKDVSFAYQDRPIVSHLSSRILRGDRVGIIGPNGSGKSTLLNLILGKLKPDTGEVVLGTRLQLAYFDQHRHQLDLEKSVRDNLSEGNDYITIAGRSRHVISYLKNFLFPAEKIDTPVKALSGGERNRLLLAKTFSQPANLLVLDEPTNDLDVDTLELLEQLLIDYDGTLLLVSHDRAFLDNVVTSTLVFEGDGVINEYVGGYEDWLRQRRAIEHEQQARQKQIAQNGMPEQKNKASAKPAKLSYKDQRELEQLPGLIEQLEQEQKALHDAVSQADFYQQEKDVIAEKLERIQAVEQELEQAYRRWEELDV